MIILGIFVGVEALTICLLLNVVIRQAKLIDACLDELEGGQNLSADMPKDHTPAFGRTKSEFGRKIK